MKTGLKKVLWRKYEKNTDQAAEKKNFSEKHRQLDACIGSEHGSGIE
jgi:hypothetical protein